MTVRARIAGIGRWGKVLINSVSNSEAITFTVGCTGRKELARAYCVENNIDLRDSLDDLLTDPDIYAIILATPHRKHAEQLVLCAEAGKHVFVEKPFTMSAESAARAASSLTNAGLVCALGHNRRFLPAMSRLREIVSSGEIGQLLHVEANISAPSGGHHPDGHWRNDPAETPAGGMTALGVHMTDALISLIGPVNKVHATSEQRVLNGSIDDVTYLTIRFAGSVTGYMSTVFVTAKIWFIRIIGSKGWASMQGYQDITHLQIGGQKETREHFAELNIERAELEAFAEAVEGGAPYPLPVPEAIHGTAVLEAIIRSSETGETVTVLPLANLVNSC